MASTPQNFELLKEQTIPELNSTARLYRHGKTGAELLTISNADENKVFGITFRTPPADSTGVAHIMEHSVLCGSQKYPLKEPFVELIKGSLNTFLNAFTFPDKTCYPVASQNVQDFYNLIDVYIDAVLHPLIPPETLQQEGWHYEVDGPDGEITYKGVVFNEMKGAYSDPENRMGRGIQQSLFPDNAYGVDSGGDPRKIPDLTYEQFKRFHATYYHPSNARIFFYGDDPEEERLRRMDAALSDFEAAPVESNVPLQERFDAPRRVTIYYDTGAEAAGAEAAGAGPTPDGLAKKGMLTVNWLLDEGSDPQQVLALQVLGYILIGTPAAPLRKALIDSGLGEDLTGPGLESDLRQLFFSTGLKGIDPSQADEVERLILDTLAGLERDGIEADTIAAAVNTIEFRLRENNTGSFPRGIALMLRSLTSWLYGGDPLAPLAFEAPLNAIKERLTRGETYFEGLIRRYLLDNPHRSVTLLRPEPGLNQRESEAERARLAQVQAALDPAELAELAENARRLKERQETPDSPEALATIPSLTLGDLDRENKLIPLAITDLEGTRVLYHDLFTNGIVYLDLGFDLRRLPQELLPYVSLFGRSLLELGTEREDYVKLSQRIGRTTGGIRPASFTSATVEGDAEEAAWLFLRGKSTVPQVSELLSILRDVLLTARLDNRERFRQMALEEKAEQEAALAPAGHRFVNGRLRSRFHRADWVGEQMGGISYLFFLRGLVEAIEKDWSSVLANLEALRSLLLSRHAAVVNVTLEEPIWKLVQPQVREFLAGLPAGSSAQGGWEPQPGPDREALTFPAQVNYVGKGADLYALGYHYHGSVGVITNYLRTTWLWEKVRVQGGAYGGFCAFDHRSGVFTFLSYRDPNLLDTLANYDATGRFLRSLDLSQEELTKSIIGTIGDIDAYQLPDAKGFTSLVRYLVGESDATRQRRREEVLSTTVQDFHRFGEILESVKENGKVVVLGSPDAIGKAKAEWGEGLEVTKVL